MRGNLLLGSVSKGMDGEEEVGGVLGGMGKESSCAL